MIKVSAPGNIFLSEEHVCVYTRTALLSAPDLRTIFSVEAGHRGISVLSRSLGRASAIPISGRLDGVSDALVPTFMLVEKVAKDYDLKLEPLKIIIDSEIPVGSGLSSSTALLISGYFAIAKFLGEDPWRLSIEEVYERVFPLQEYIHEKTSGMEIFSSHIGGFSLVRERKLSKHFGFEGPACVIGDTGISRQTSAVVAAVAKWKARQPEDAEEIFSRISRITGEQDFAISREDWEMVGELMNENHILLSRMGVSHNKLNLMVNAAVNAGAYGAKLSGAGWGGVMFALCPSTRRDAVTRAIARYGRAFPTRLGAEGVRPEH